MTYRDDRDADRARIEALEAELAQAKGRVAELEGRHEQALVLASGGALAGAAPKSAAKTWLGSPLELGLSREFPGAYPTDKFEDLIEPCRALTRDAGRTEILKSSLTWSMTSNPKNIGPFIVVTVAVRDGMTRLSITDRLGQAAGAMYGGIGGGVGLGGVAAPIGLGIAVMPVLAPVFAVVWLGATFGVTRKIFKGIARRRATLMQQVFDALVEDIDAGIAAQ